MATLLEALRDLDDSTIIADALAHYADALRHGGDYLARTERKKASPLFTRARRAEALAVHINQKHQGGTI